MPPTAGFACFQNSSTLGVGTERSDDHVKVDRFAHTGLVNGTGRTLGIGGTTHACLESSACLLVAGQRQSRLDDECTSGPPA